MFVKVQWEWQYIPALHPFSASSGKITTMHIAYVDDPYT